VFHAYLNSVTSGVHFRQAVGVVDSAPQHHKGQSLFSLKQEAVSTKIDAVIEHGVPHPVNGLALRHHSVYGAMTPPIRSTILTSTRPAALARWRTNLSGTPAEADSDGTSGSFHPQGFQDRGPLAQALPVGANIYSHGGPYQGDYCVTAASIEARLPDFSDYGCNAPVRQRQWRQSF
jgi:hypothetical protein